MVISVRLVEEREECKSKRERRKRKTGSRRREANRLEGDGWMDARRRE